MQLSEFDFPFDHRLIADHPVEPRDQAKLLVIARARSSFQPYRVADLPDLLAPGDLLVVNDTRVRAAKLTGRKCPSGGRIDCLLLAPQGQDEWQVLLKGKVEPGQRIEFDPRVSATVIGRHDTMAILRFSHPFPSFKVVFDELGAMPLPPYIKREPVEADRAWYQTVFAKVEGAVAAPTAGLHFTAAVLDRLRERGIGIGSVTLHVGPATFQPVRVDNVQEHHMGEEWRAVPEETVRLVEETKARGGRVVAVGTTVVRTLESVMQEYGRLVAVSGETRLFIRPGFQFQCIDGMLTNFHLPRTTLLMLVSAFAGIDTLKEAYRIAVAEQYRCYSYGDAMLIL
jgi:S-adenosylmethionine:tRNA ribosyltransferase-isomerase